MCLPFDCEQSLIIPSSLPSFFNLLSTSFQDSASFEPLKIKIRQGVPPVHECQKKQSRTISPFICPETLVNGFSHQKNVTIRPFASTRGIAQLSRCRAGLDDSLRRNEITCTAMWHTLHRCARCDIMTLTCVN